MLRIYRSGISGAVTAVIVVVIIIIAGVAASYYVVTSTPSHSTTSTLSSTTSPISTTGSVSTTVSGHTFIEDNLFGFPNSVDVDSLNSWTGQGLSQDLYQTLVWYKGNTTNPVGVLATSWNTSPNGTIYTFNLKQGVVFSDGKPFSAYDVWFNMYRYVVDQGPYSYILAPVLTNLPGGANATMHDLNTFNFTSPSSSALAVMESPDQSVQVVNQYTVAFHLSGPSGAFIEEMGSAAAAIEEPDWVQSHGGVLGPGKTNTFLTSNPPPGTGPYVLKSWVTGASVTLAANPHYSPTPYFTTVIVNYVSNFADALNSLKTGTINGLWAVPFLQANETIGQPGISVDTKGISWFTQAIAINTQAYPLNITDVRLAITYATNRTALMQASIGRYGTLFQGPVPAGMLGYNSSIAPLPYNVTMARQLLTQAGFPNGAGIRPLTFMYSSADPVAAAEVFQSEMKQIGITVQLNEVAQSVVGACITTLPRCSNYPDFAFHAWSPDYAFPTDYAWTFDNIGSTNNGPNLNNTLLNQLTNELLVTSNPTQVDQIVSQIALADRSAAGWIWLWQAAAPGPGIVAWANGIQGVTTHINPLSVDFNYSSMYE